MRTQVTVLVMAARAETVPLADRVAWLRAACEGLPAVTVAGVRCDVPVDFGSEAGLGGAGGGDGRRPGRERHGRRSTPSSAASRTAMSWRPGSAPGMSASTPAGRRCRCRPARSAPTWPAAGMTLIGPARAGLAARVVVVGAESTGTSTIARAACRALPAPRRRLGAHPVRARGRPGLHGHQVAAGPRRGRRSRPARSRRWRNWSGRPADFDAVAAEQTRRENAGRHWRGRRWWCATPTRSPPRCGNAGTWARRGPRPAAVGHDATCRATTCTW